MCDSDPLAEYAQEEEPVDLMQRAQVKYLSYHYANTFILSIDDVGFWVAVTCDISRGDVI